MIGLTASRSAKKPPSGHQLGKVHTWTTDSRSAKQKYQRHIGRERLLQGPTGRRSGKIHDIADGLSVGNSSYYRRSVGRQNFVGRQWAFPSGFSPTDLIGRQYFFPTDCLLVEAVIPTNLCVKNVVLWCSDSTYAFFSSLSPIWYKSNFQISGWVVAHPGHPLPSPLVSKIGRAHV